jgi:hypothetical protein
MVDKTVVTYVESLLNAIVSVEVNMDVYVTVVTGTVMLVVNLETDEETGTTRAPLGRLAVELVGPGMVLVETGVVVDEELIATGEKLNSVLSTVREDGAESVVASDMVVNGDIGSGREGGVVISVDDCVRTASVAVTLWAGILFDVLVKTARANRANRTGCEALG